MKSANYVDTSEMKVGEQYYFVEAHFHYETVKTPIVARKTIYRIVEGSFSTKEPGDQYEVIRGCALRTEEEARQEAIRELELYKGYIVKQIDEHIAELTLQEETK